MSSWSAKRAASAGRVSEAAGRRSDASVVRVLRRRRGRARLAIAAAVLLLGSALSAHAALSVLPGRPGTKTPRPTGTPLVAGTKGACQARIQGAAAELATAVRASLAECLAVAMPCVLEQGGAAACCGAAAAGCVRQAEEIATAEAAFVADVVSPPCSTLPFADLESESGLDFERTDDACGRLDPPVTVDGLGSLATCLERLVTEDVLHLATTTEQPRALEALVCMDLENRFPGVLRERPATCENLPVATPTPAPTPVESPTPGTSPGSSPSPGGSPGAPTPTPGAATPTPGAATPTPQPTSGGATCTQADVKIAVNYNRSDFPDVAGITVALQYPASVNIPGLGGQQSVIDRIANLTGLSGGLFSVGDQDDESRVNIGLISIGTTIPPGNFARVRFDCASGASLPASGSFTCTVDASTSDGNLVSPTQCLITVSAP
jgi:hypothetical protein